MKTLTEREKALAHYMGVLLEAQESIAQEAAQFDRAVKAHRDEEELLRADPAYSQWLDKLNQQKDR